MQDFLAGELVLVDKPLKWTSFDVVNKLRYTLKKATGVKKLKVGHAGTLDPLATGLLVICTGKKTKTIESIQGQVKEYTGCIQLGGTTPSYDLETEIENQQPIAHLTKVQIKATAASFEGMQDQLPPIFSAKKIDGKRAYLKARKGETPKMKSKEILIHFFEVEKIELPLVYFKISCSSGTYIRSIANDFGEKLKVGGFLKSLRRTKIGAYSVENAIQVEEFAAFDKN